MIISLVVGVVLNLINQGHALLTLDISSLSLMKAVLTFIVPYLVSTYSTVIAKLSFEVGDKSSITTNLVCTSCHQSHIHVHEGEVIPVCNICLEDTRWRVEASQD